MRLLLTLGSLILLCVLLACALVPPAPRACGPVSVVGRRRVVARQARYLLRRYCECPRGAARVRPYALTPVATPAPVAVVESGEVAR
ncbi:hypothetical protein GCM10022402_10680 [Salinactinospora qingdaonensis]|uniref:Secreted protein n=1 Tax=Salinactinospora qingdaonensis TaxID=702744 RepID=A0ABP7F5E4_9ACTN